MLAKLLASGDIHVEISVRGIDIMKLMELEAYEALEKIKAVIHDDSLDDPECFMKIEQIILALEALGNGGWRHDF